LTETSFDRQRNREVWIIAKGNMGPQNDSDSVPTIHAALNRGINRIDTAALCGLGTF